MVDNTLNTAVIDETLIASISHILIKNKIPCVLWGNYLLTVYGVPSIVDSIDFIVPDVLVAASASALRNRGLADCSDLKSCSAVASSRSSPAPAAHFHIDAEITVSIYRQSSVLWFLPNLNLERIVCSPDIILASDSRLPHPRPGRGHGAFRTGSYPVYIPTAHRLLEAYIRLVARPDQYKYKHFGIAMITYIEEYVDGDGLLEEARLESRCRKFYSELKSGKKPMARVFEELKASLPRV